MTSEQKPINRWQQALSEQWKGCAAVPMALEQARPSDIILAQYTRPTKEDSPPPEYTDAMEIFIMLEKPDEKFVRDFRALRIAQLSATGEVLGSVSWGATSLPEGAKLWLLGSCSGALIPDTRWLELSENAVEDDLV